MRQFIQLALQLFDLVLKKIEQIVREEMDRAGAIVLADQGNNALRKVEGLGAVVTSLAGNGEEGFEDGRGDAARFNNPLDVVLTHEGEYAVADQGNHALGAASCGGHLELVKALVEKGAPLELKNQIGTSPLWLAAGYGHADVLDFLIGAGADVNAEIGRASCRERV